MQRLAYLKNVQNYRILKDKYAALASFQMKNL
jgi:hypothetical protein